MGAACTLFVAAWALGLFGDSFVGSRLATALFVFAASAVWITVAYSVRRETNHNLLFASVTCHMMTLGCFAAVALTDSVALAVASAATAIISAAVGLVTAAMFLRRRQDPGR
jgi:hypothetical protein